MSGDRESATDEDYPLESRLARKMSGEAESTCDDGSREVGKICLAPKNLPVLRALAESLDWRGNVRQRESVCDERPCRKGRSIEWMRLIGQVDRVDRVYRDGR